MPGIVATAPWIMFDNKTFDEPCAFIRCADTISTPFFSKMAGKMYCKKIADEQGLAETDFLGAMQAIDDSDLPGNPLPYDLMALKNQQLLAQRGIRLPHEELIAMLQRIYKSVKEDMAAEGIDVKELNRKSGRENSDAVFHFEYDEESFSSPCGRYVGEAGGQPAASELFFSKQAGEVMIITMTNDVGISLAVQQALAEQLAQSALPDKMTDLDLAIHSFSSYFYRSGRMQLAHQHLEILIKNDMLVDLFGPCDMG